MNQISLSIEELIYCFYSEGYFEEGNALKQVYFGDLDDEKMDLLLQISCRTLLAKELLDYQDHKFTLKKGIAEIISALNYSEQSIKASRHSSQGGEESLSFHFKDSSIIKHSLHYDEQVHTFAFVSLQEVSSLVHDFYRVGEGDADLEMLMTQGELEEMLSSLQDNGKQFDAPQLTGARKQFNQILQDTNGRLNTLLFLEFNDDKEPLAKNVVMFTNNPNNNWIIEKQGELFDIKSGNKGTIDTLLERNLSNSMVKEIQ
jgi:hypothetical protein